MSIFFFVELKTVMTVCFQACKRTQSSYFSRLSGKIKYRDR